MWWGCGIGLFRLSPGYADSSLDEAGPRYAVRCGLLSPSIPRPFQVVRKFLSRAASRLLGNLFAPSPLCRAIAVGDRERVGWPEQKRKKKFTALVVLILTAVFIAGVSSSGNSLAQDSSPSQDTKTKGAKTNRTAPGPQISVVYPSNGVLTPGEPQIIQVAVTVHPAPSAPLNAYRVLLKMRRHNAQTVVYDYFYLKQASSVLTLNIKKLPAAAYDLIAKLERDATAVPAAQQYQIEKLSGSAATPTITPTPTPPATATATPTSTRTTAPTTTATATRSTAQTPTSTATTTAIATATTPRPQLRPLRRREYRHPH